MAVKDFSSHKAVAWLQKTWNVVFTIFMILLCFFFFLSFWSSASHGTHPLSLNGWFELRHSVKKFCVQSKKESHAGL